MAKILTTLGFKDVYRAVDTIDTPNDWEVVNRAAEATSPNVPTHKGTAFSPGGWDRIFGLCEAATDVASLFGPQLAEAYPDAKVVLVQRDIERWYTSFDDSVLKDVFGKAPGFFISYVEPLLGLCAGAATRKMLFGFFEASDVDGIRANARFAC